MAQLPGYGAPTVPVPFRLEALALSRSVRLPRRNLLKYGLVDLTVFSSLSLPRYTGTLILSKSLVCFESRSLISHTRFPRPNTNVFFGNACYLSYIDVPCKDSQTYSKTWATTPSQAYPLPQVNVSPDYAIKWASDVVPEQSGQSHQTQPSVLAHSSRCLGSTS